jgi:hypothetical protein
MPDRPPAPVAEASQASAAASQTKVGFSDRWLDPTATAFAAPLPPIGQPNGAESSLGYSAAAGMFTPDQLKRMPPWPIKDARAN